MIASDNWDVVCIGSGITGLTFACEIQRLYPGLRVLVLEKHTVPGGYASEFHRPKLQARFDCSLHKLSGMGPSGNLRRTLREMQLESALDIHMEDVLFDAALPQRSFLLPTDPGDALAALIQAFPGEAVGLKRYFEEVATSGHDLYMQFRTMLGEYQPDTARLRYSQRTLKHLTVFEGLRRHVQDPELIEILSMPVVYVGGFPEQIGYLYFLHVAYACQFMGCAYIKGGAQHLSDLLVARIRARGGEVLLSTRAEHILLDDARRRATGVLTTRGQFSAGHVVVNASPDHTVNELLSSYSELDHTRSLVAELKPSNATTTAYLVTDVPASELGLSHAEIMLFSDSLATLEQQREAARAAPEDAAFCEDVYWRQSTAEVTNYSLLDGERGNVIVINVLDDIRQWPARKTPEYRSKKARAVEALTERLYRRVPALRSHVTYAEVSSPRTYLRYTNNTGGSGYGAIIGPRSTGHGFHHRFPVSNVSFMSAWAAGSGYEAAMGYAAMKARGFRHLFEHGAQPVPVHEAV